MDEWKEIDTKTSSISSQIMYVKGKYYMVVYQYDKSRGTVFYSENLSEWTEINVNPKQIAYNGRNYTLGDVGPIEYINGMFIGKADYAAPYSQGLNILLPGRVYSVDGVNWTGSLNIINGKIFYFENIFSLNNTIVIRAYESGVANSYCFLTTKDGKNFTEYNYTGIDFFNTSLFKMCYFNNKYYSMVLNTIWENNKSYNIHTIYSSSNLTNWTKTKVYNRQEINSVVVGKGKMILLVDDYSTGNYSQTKIISSSNGIDFSERIFTNNASERPHYLSYLNGTFILYSSKNVWFSTNGDDWNKIEFDKSIINNVIYNDNKLMLFGQNLTARTIKIFYKEISRDVNYAEDTALYVFDKKLNLLGVIDECVSLTWTRKYYEAGEFSLVVAPYENNINLLKTDNIIIRQNYTEAAIIDTVEGDDDGTQTEIKASGSFLSYLLHRRIVKNKVKFSGSAIDGQKELLANMTELVSNFEIESTKLDSENVDFQCTYKNVYDYMVKLSKYGNMGFRIVPNVETKGFIFENFMGLDRTHNQIKNERYSFSKENSNINKSNILKTTIGKCNFALVGGVGEDTNRKLVEVKNGDFTGLDLFETFVDAKSESNNNMTTSDYEKILKQKGEEALQDESLTIEFTGEPTDYKTKWDLGDIVDLTLADLGITEANRITEVEEVIEKNNYSIRPTFGPPLADKLNLDE